jgi:hypothetical protein
MCNEFWIKIVKTSMANIFNICTTINKYIKVLSYEELKVGKVQLVVEAQP